MTTTAFDAEAIADFGRYLGAEAYASLRPIGNFTCREGMSKVGFGEPPSLLSPLGDLVSGPAADLVSEGFVEMQRKLCQLGDTVIAAGVSYGAVEDANGSLSQQINLDNDTCIPDPQIVTDHSSGGGSQFTVTELSLSDPDRPTADFTDQIGDSLGGEVLSFLDWIWTEFNVAGGESFTGSIISPLVGNPQSIQANGDAWKTAATGMADLAGTMGANLLSLATNEWQGDAADALRDFVTKYWKDGAAWVAAQVGDFIAKGFDEVAEVCTKLGGLAIDAIEKIINLAIKQAARAIPLLGWAWTAIEAAASFIGWLLGIDIDNVITDILEIVDLAQKVLGLFDAIEQIVESMKDYINQVQSIVDFVKSIPDLSAIDPTEIANKVNEFEAKQQAVKDALAKGGETLEDVATAAEEAAGD